MKPCFPHQEISESCPHLIPTRAKDRTLELPPHPLPITLGKSATHLLSTTTCGTLSQNWQHVSRIQPQWSSQGVKDCAKRTKTTKVEYTSRDQDGGCICRSRSGC
eukprot:Lithocolla_globosa_v1_NODE_5520_length_1227_cov_20.932594.p3 type:complete len:105 gc:universal NODE_5520_length_1227_cov_20.932594:464-778(+)